MAAEVSRQIKSEGKPGGPITRDFLGRCFGIESKELDLDLQVPARREKRLDLKSGKVYIQRCIQPSSPSDHKHTNPTNQTLPSSSKMQDLNFPPHLSKPNRALNLSEDTTLDLKLVLKSPSNPLTNYHSATYQSVCTLDKVKSALDSAWRVASPTSSSSRKRPSPSSSASSRDLDLDQPVLNPNPSSRDHQQALGNPSTGFRPENGSGMLVAGACPGCLLYVLMSQSNPKCPKCNSVVPLPVMPKKPKIDLNISM